MMRFEFIGFQTIMEVFYHPATLRNPSIVYLFTWIIVKDRTPQYMGDEQEMRSSINKFVAEHESLCGDLRTASHAK